MPEFHDDIDTLSLTKEEKKWCAALEKLLLSCPERFGVYTIWDCDLTIYDREEMKARGIEEGDGSSGVAKLNLAIIHSKTPMLGLCG